MLMASRSFSITGNWAFRVGSMGGRVALYCSNASVRNAGRPLSKAHTMASGFEISMNFISMERKPKTALVGVPSGATMEGGTA